MFTVNYYVAIAIIFLGVIILTFEALVTTGIFSFIGAAVLLLGAYVIVYYPEGVVIQWYVALPIAITLIGSISTLAWCFFSTYNLKRVSGSEALLGMIGKVKRIDAQSGEFYIFVSGELWLAELTKDVENYSASGNVELNDEVEVVAVDGIRLEVKKVS